METSELIMSGLQLKKLIARKAEPVMREYDLRPVELDILVFLKKEKEIDTARGIMQKKHLSKAHVSKSIENLHTRGFIRITEDEEDHRLLHIRLTDKSEEVVWKVTSVYTECKQILQEGIREEEFAVMNRVIQKMTENVNRELGEI